MATERSTPATRFHFPVAPITAVAGCFAAWAGWRSTFPGTRATIPARHPAPSASPYTANLTAFAGQTVYWAVRYLNTKGVPGPWSATERSEGAPLFAATSFPAKLRRENGVHFPFTPKLFTISDEQGEGGFPPLPRNRP